MLLTMRILEDHNRVEGVAQHVARPLQVLRDQADLAQPHGVGHVVTKRPVHVGAMRKNSRLIWLRARASR